MFRDRSDAGERLATLIQKDPVFSKYSSELVVVSLLRGGAVVGSVAARVLGATHIPLIVIKISAPGNEELAIGALCGNSVYRDEEVIDDLKLNSTEINSQIEKAKIKQQEYVKRFSLSHYEYQKVLHGKYILLIDDGVATGSTVRAAALFVRSHKPLAVALAVPIAPTDFNESDFDTTFILQKELFFSAVGQFYENFPQVEDVEVKQYF